jgi:outer membrane lipoprotein-sorting protein
MMLRRLFTLLFAGALLATPVAAQTLDEVIAKNLEARGGEEKLKALSSLRASGKMTMGPGMEAPFTFEWVNPNHIRMEITLQGMTLVQAYDGKSGWMINPFQGKKEPEALSAEDLKDVEDQSDILGALLDWKKKGHQVELVGKETVEGTAAYKLKVLKKNGDTEIIYLDADAYLPFKEESKRKVRGQEMEIETSVGDYKEVGGLVFAHAYDSKPKGAPQGQVMTIEKIELGVDVPVERFAMPEVKKEEPKPEPGKGEEKSPANKNDKKEEEKAGGALR